MADAPSWDDVKKLLDDPNVPDDQKAELAKNFEAYDDDWSVFGTEDRVQPYLDRYGGGYWNTQGRQTVDGLEDLNPFSGASWSSGGHAKQYLIDSYNRAKDSSDKAAKENKQHNDDVSKGKQTLEDARNASADGGTGVDTSDKLLDAGKAGLRYYDRFLPLYGKLPDVVKKNPPQGATMTADFVHQRYDEHRGINFAHFKRDADEMVSCASTERGEHQEMSNKLAGLWNHWTGPASRSSQDHFSGFAQHVEKITQALDDTANISKLAMHNISDAVRTKAQWLLDNDRNSDTYDGKSPAQVEVVIRCAAGNASDDELKQACGYVGLQLDDGNCDDETYKSKVPPAAIRWLNGFAADMEGRVGAFVKTCDSTKQRVDDAFTSLTDQLGKITGDPFASQGDGDQPGDHTGSGGHGGGGSGGSGGGGGAGGGAHGGGGAPAPAGAGPVPSGGGVPAGVGGPGAGGGVPSAPQVPGHTMPAGYAPPAAGQPETVKIQDGSRTIEVASPDGQGHVKLTVDTGNGQPKSYDLDFGTCRQVPAAPGVPGVPGGVAGGPGQPGVGMTGPGQPGQLGAVQPGQLPPGQPGAFAPGQPGQQGPFGAGQAGAPGPLGPGQPASSGGPGLPGQFGAGPFGPVPGAQHSGATFGPPDAVPGQPAAPGQVIPTHAGPDGRAVVHDGPLTITAEHPGGSPDKLTITVDDGHGKPTTYTVDYQDQAGDPPGQPQHPGGQQPGLVPGPGTPPGGPMPAAWAGGPAGTPQHPGLVDAQQGAALVSASPQPFEPGADGPRYPATPAASSDSSAGFGSPTQPPYGAGQGGPMSTVTASAGFGSPGDMAGGGGALWGTPGGGPDVHPPGGGQAGDVWGGQGGEQHHPPGLGDTSTPQVGGPGGAGLASMPDAGADHGHQPGGQAAQGGAMMPMMGGGMGAAGGQGGDQERGGSQWRTHGQLFDDITDAGRAVRGVLGDDDRR